MSLSRLGKVGNLKASHVFQVLWIKHILLYMFCDVVILLF